MAGSHNFKEETGEMQFDASGYLRVNVSAGGAGDGSILDGVSSSIKATVFDYTSSNPLAVVLRDTNGDYVSVGGGTQYTEDAVATADPVGTSVNLIRKDTPATITSTDGDNVAQRGTNYGAAYVQVVNSSGSFIDTFGGGTQYADGAVRGTATGTIAMGDDGTNIQSIKVDAAGELQVDVLTMPVVAVTQSGTWDEVGINDSGNSITVDNPTLSVVGGGVEATALRVTIASDSTGLVSVDDNGGSLTVDGTVSVTGVATEVTLASLLTSSQLIDDTIIVLGTDTYTEATSKGQIIAAVRRDADTTLVNTTNEYGPLQMDANGRLKVEAFSGETLPVSLTSTTITGTVAVTQSGTWVLGANSGVDIGDVTINNAAGASAVNIQDGGNSITVDGTITEASGSGILTSVQLIDDAIYASDAALNKTMGIGAVFDDVATVAITENQAGYVRMSSRRALLVEGVASGTAINVLDTNSAAALTALQLIDNAVSGAGFNITQLGGTAISMNTGVRDAGTQRVTIATNDAVPVTFTGSTDVATQTTLASLLTSSQLVDDVVFTAGTSLFTEATSKGALSLAVRRDANTSLVGTTNEMTPLQVNATGELKVAVIQALPAGSAIIGKTGIDQTTPGTTNLVALSAETTKVIGTVNQGTSPWVTSNATTSVVGNGAAATAQRVTIANDSTGILAGVTTVSTVSLNSDIRQATAANLNAQVVGSIAHDGIDSGNPVGIAYRAIAHGANPTAVAAADRTVGYANRAGIPFVMAGHPNVITREVTVLAADGAQTNAAFVTVAAGLKIVVTRCSVTASAANTVNVAVRIGFGAATLGAEALAGVNGIILAHPAVAAGSGVVEGNGSGILGIGADDEDIRYTCGSPTTGSIKIIISYYTIES